MHKKEIAKAMYISGEKPAKIAEELGYKANTISNYAAVEGWDKERQERTNKIVEGIEGQISALTELSLSELNRILTDIGSKDSDKLSAIRLVIDISGLKKENQSIDIDSRGIEVVINQIPIKVGKVGNEG